MNAVTLPVLAAITAALTSLTTPPDDNSTTPLATQTLSYAQARHLLMRAGFGGTPAEIKRLQALGVEGAVRHLVRFASIPTEFVAHGVTPVERPSREMFRMLDEDGRRKMRQKLRREDSRKLSGLRAWWIDRMLKSPRPFEEKMTLFLHGHLTSGYRDVRNAHHMAMQNDLYRKHAAGNFIELVQAVAKDPAMLEYLDNNRNNRRAPNENFARELMELFTLGEGHYTEKDIKEAARAFTGWTFHRREGGFHFNRGQHDFGKKTFLGQTGRFNGGDIIRIIFEQKEASQHLASELIEFFAIKATPSEIAPYAEILRQSKFDLAPFFTTLFSSKWFYSDRVRGQQVKSPVVLMISTLRMLGHTDLRSGACAMLALACRNVGQELFQPPNVKGWDGGAAWVTSSNLLTRYNMLRTVITGNAPNRNNMQSNRGGSQRDRRRNRTFVISGSASQRLLSELRKKKPANSEEVLKELEARFLSVPLAPARRQTLLDFLAGADGSPTLDLQNKPRRWSNKVKELLHLLTTTPEFQIN